MVNNQTKAVVPYLRTFDTQELELLRALVKQVAPKATNDEVRLFLYTAQKKGLDPFVKQIYLVPRWDSKQSREVHSVQVSIDGLRLMAQRSGKYAGQTPYQWCGSDGKWVDVWLADEQPLAARVGILRHDFKEPLYSVALFKSYKQVKADKVTLNVFWEKYGAHMLAKCAEALSIRRAFPEETSGFYIPEEMGNPELTYVEEAETDVTAPIVGELVEEAATPKNSGATETPKQPATSQNKNGATKSVPSNKTPETAKDKIADDLANIPTVKDLRELATALEISWENTLAGAFKSGIEKGKLTLEKLIAGGDELPPNYCKIIEAHLNEYAAQPMGIAS